MHMHHPPAHICRAGSQIRADVLVYLRAEYVHTSSLVAVDGSFPIARICADVTGYIRVISHSFQTASTSGLGLRRATDG